MSLLTRQYPIGLRGSWCLELIASSYVLFWLEWAQTDHNLLSTHTQKSPTYTQMNSIKTPKTYGEFGDSLVSYFPTRFVLS